MWHEHEEEIIDRGKCLGYTGEPCTKCSRVRVEAYENGDKICEKCRWNETKGQYEPDDY
jgi:ribosomal protein L37AE/L43A